MSDYKIMLVNMDDFERLQFPNVDAKRAFVDKMLADKLNEVIAELEDLKKTVWKDFERSVDLER